MSASHSSSTHLTQKLKIWDLPTRLFHWSMVLLLAALWWSAEVGEMQWHQIFAYSLMVLILFRLLWGFIGSDTARFSHFVKSPAQVLAYIRQPKSVVIGHNPLGGYMVVTMILVLLLQLVTGLFATDEVFTEGPLYSYVSESVSGTLTWLHKMNFNLLLVLIALHILAVISHVVKGDKLVGAMITGHKRVAADLSPQLRFSSNLLALLLVGVLAGLAVNYLILPLTAML
ncbi:cytochrome b/b6 domain-containing protein [Shewanella sp. AS1]|uniref:cytochrome b/b6 domain-containing protein n=1 Tax=Shewanella sp. AS1 TaxID=2907626 RepID=UPI001F3DF4EC|nr:cytochrome b/b6 domain-containing protein [Shewanella sp. AS1]MCE9677985.1 cytochrome b/b6 domain-containing protein [Shewanella sp. AS1]